MKTRRRLRRKTLRGGDPAVIGAVVGGILAVGIGAMMYMRSRKSKNQIYHDPVPLMAQKHAEKDGNDYL